METLRTRYLREVAGGGPFLGCEGTVRGGTAVMPSAATAALTAEVCSHASEEHFMVIAERHFPRSGSGTSYPDITSAPRAHFFRAHHSPYLAAHVLCPGHRLGLGLHLQLQVNSNMSALLKNIFPLLKYSHVDNLKIAPSPPHPCSTAHT